MKKRTTLGILVVLFCLVCSAALAAAPGKQRVLRVGVINKSVYANRGSDGTWSGIDIECLTNIAQRTGLKFEYVDSTLDADFLENLKKGKYDVLADIVKTPEREKEFIFNDATLGYMNTNFVVRLNDDRWEYGDVEQISRMKVGLLATYSYNRDFRAWCAKRKLTPRIFEFKDIAEMTKALESGKIDGEVYTAMYGKDYMLKFRPIMKMFLPQPFYFAFRPNDTVLKNVFDGALSNILAENPNYLVSLSNKYFFQFKADIIPFSKKEKEYIARHPVIDVAVVENDMPYYNKLPDGRDAGIIPDYYAMLSAGTGFKFRFTAYKTHKEAVGAVKGGIADVVGLFSSGLISAAKDGLALTNSFSVANNVMITRSGTDTSKIKNVAVKERVIPAVKSMNMPVLAKAELDKYNNADECFHKLESGRVDAAIVAFPSATWILNHTNSSAYGLAPLPGLGLELCSAVNNGNTTLFSILNKRITATKNNFNGVVTSNTMPENNWRTFIARIPADKIAAVTSLLILMVIVLVWALFMLARRQKERASVLAERTKTERRKIQLEAIQKNTEERNNFFSNISHDMRTPLNAIIGFSELASEKVKVPEVADYLSKIKQSGNLLLSLINDTLTISKMQNGKLDFHPEATKTRDITSSVVAAVSTDAANKNVTFTVDDSGIRQRTILCDKLNLQKVLLNLLSNAVKFTPAGGHVWYTAKDDPAGSPDPDIVITVRDDGIGMSREYQQHLFEPFTQEKRSGYEALGTGLGLSIVKQLIDLMGGSISMQSEINKGTTFTVRLHFTEAPDSDVETCAKDGGVEQGRP
jgi:signal transduction histidine kinase